MSMQKVLVLDANILVRACLGSRVFQLIEKFEQSVNFYSPEICFSDAQRHLPTIFESRGLEVTEGLLTLERLSRFVHPVELPVYQEHEKAALKRIGQRDPSDWHVVAAALYFKCPIWTEDQDFFGSGVPTWTTNRVELYLEEVQ